MMTATRALVAAAEREDDPVNGINARMFRLMTHILGGGDRRTPPADWRPTYSGDDPRNEPDLWIADQSGDEVIWCQLAAHEPQPDEHWNACSWCGQMHFGIMEVFTYMLPEDH
jgi:hypothetical protein